MQTQTSLTSRLGGWLFKHRTSLPMPVAAAIVVIPSGDAWWSAWVVLAGVAVTLSGELVRLWGVHHIGVISRTRSDRLGPLVATGPFALVRNPLYIGNIMLWVGFALTARLAWLAPVIVVLLGLEYHAIVRWEETLLESRLGEAYRTYAARVPRWLPGFVGQDRREHENISASVASSAVKRYSLGETLFSERGTLIAIAGGYILLWLKLRSHS